MKIKIKRSVLKQAVEDAMQDSTLQSEGYQALKALTQSLNGKALVRYKGQDVISIATGGQKSVLVKVIGFDK